MSIIVREFKISDIEPIDEIYRRQPNIDVPSRKYLIVNGTIENSETGNILGYGAVKIFAEAILILDKELPKRDRAKAIIETMKAAVEASKNAGLEHLFAVTSDPSFARVLENRYKFQEIRGRLFRMDL